MTFPAQSPDLRRFPLGRRSFAVSGPLAPVRSASYPVPVRRLTGSFHASFSVRLTTNALRFPSVPATRFREDFHLQVIAHAGPTTARSGAARCLGNARLKRGAPAGAPLSCILFVSGAPPPTVTARISSERPQDLDDRRAGDRTGHDHQRLVGRRRRGLDDPPLGTLLGGGASLASVGL